MVKSIEYNISRESALQLIEDYLDFVGLKTNDGKYGGINGDIIIISPDKKSVTLFPNLLTDDKKTLTNILWLLENQSEIDNLVYPTDKIKLLKLNSFLNKHYQD